MTRVMLDALNPNNIPLPLPLGATMVAGYIDLNDAWPASAWDRFHTVGITVVYIARSASTDAGDVLDVETGLAKPAEAPQWVVKRRSAGYPNPIVYCSMSIWAAVIAQFNLQQVPQPDYWVAAYPGIGPVIPVGAIGHQYERSRPYDVSVMADYIPGVDPVTDPFTADSVDNPILNPADGSYSGTDSTTPTDFADDERFTNASVRWIIEQWIPKIDAQITALQTSVSALTGLGTLSGTATVVVQLNPEGH